MSQNQFTVAVIGGGTMGAGIVEVAASAGHPVRLYDISAEAITRAIDGIASFFLDRADYLAHGLRSFDAKCGDGRLDQRANLVVA